jgi:hypothetical protein
MVTRSYECSYFSVEIDILIILTIKTDEKQFAHIIAKKFPVPFSKD